MPVRFLTLRDLDAGGVYTLTYDAENHMIDVSGAVTATFVYNGDGVRIVSTEGVTTTVYIGNYYEYAFAGENSKTVKYYYANATRVAMREDGGDPYWLLGDHLGSTSVAANFDGSLYSRQGYKPWGETRFVVGQTPTGYQFTGQYNETGLGLYFYNARFYDAALGRFVQADTIVPEPGNPNAFDRFAYVQNNPLKYIDPTGYFTEDEIISFFGIETWEDVLDLFRKGGKYEGRWGWLEILRKAELGDRITIDWGDLVHIKDITLPIEFIFGTDSNGNLILVSDGVYMEHEIAGMFGENYTLYHFTDLSDAFCSPYKCGYTTKLNTSAYHDPYLHKKIKWEKFITNMPEAIHVIEMGGVTIFTGGLTVSFIPITLAFCTNPVSCIGVLSFTVPGTLLGTTATYLLGKGTIEVFTSEFIKTTP